MNIHYFKEYSPILGREMECKAWGSTGHPFLYIPCQNGRFYDFENFHMLDVMAPWIESGEIIVFSIDTMDMETYSSFDDPHKRILRHEQWIRYITDEMVPFIHSMLPEMGDTGVIAFGCSLGATHAANLYFRRPDLFDGLLALSGIYSSSYGFGDYMDELVYLNSPVDYLANMTADHPYMELYDRGRAVICCGQGAWEEPETTRRMKEITDYLKIPVWVDLWGYDVRHDWNWWFKQVPYFMPYLLSR